MADDLLITVNVKSNAELAYRGLRKLEGSIVNAVKDADALRRNYALLDRAFNKGHISAVQYSQGVNQLDKSIEAVINSTSRASVETRKYAASNAAATGAVTNAAAAAQRYANAQRMAGKSTNQFGMYSQQVGYQVGDFLVQIQGGTDALLAFGQQGTQLAGLLPGLAGAIIGIGLSLGTALLKASLTAKGLRIDFSALGKDILASLEPISPIVDAITAALKAVGSAASSFATALLNNLDRVVSTLSVVVAFFGVKMVGALIAAATAAGFLRAALIRTGIGALVVGAGELVYQFTRLVKGAGGFGNAMSLLYDVAVETFDGIGNYMGVLPLYLQKADEKMRLLWNKLLKYLAQEFAEFAKNVFDPLNELSLKAGGDILFDTMKLNAWASSFDAAVVKSENSLKSLDGKIAETKDNAFNGLDTALSRLMNAFAAADGETKNLDFSDYLVPDEGKDKDKKKDKESQLAALREEQRQRAILLKLFGQERILKEEIFGVTNRLGEEAKALSATQIEALAKVNVALQEQEALYEEQINKMQGIADTISSSMENAFMSMVDGTKSAKDAFRSMAADIIKELYRVLVVQQLVGSFDRQAGTGSGIVGMIGKALLNADGNAFSSGRQIQAYANGGVIGGPTYFPMAGNKTGLMGEAGPEAIMPLKRGKDGKLGVSVDGSSGTVNVVNNINVSGGSDPAAIRAEVAKLMPQITSATKSAVIDARRRGGQMRAAFQ
jgi:hypothetical protein